MVAVRKKFTPHTEETISKILALHDDGMRSKDIYKQSKAIFGFSIKQSTISQILARNGRTAKDNTFRVKRGGKSKAFANNTPPHDVNYYEMQTS